MSILNKALKDLEQRQQPHDLGLEPTVELEPYSNKNRLLLIGLGCAVTLGAVAAAYYLIPEKQQTAEQNAPAQGLVTTALPEKTIEAPTSVAEQVIKPQLSDVDDEAEYRARAQAQDQEAASAQVVQRTPEQSSQQESVDATSDNIATKAPAQNQGVVAQTNATAEPSAPESVVEPVKPVAMQALAEPVASVEPTPKKGQGNNTATVKVRALSDEQRAQNWFEQAQESMQYGMTVEGISKLEQALVLNPKHVEARSLLAATLYGQQRISEAQTILINGIKLLPPALKWRVLLAKIAISEQQYGGVLQALPNHLDEQAQALQNNDYWILKGTAASKLAQHQVAKESFTQMVRRQPNVAKWWLALASSEEALGETSQARSHYATALQLGGLSVQSQQYAQARYEGLQEQP